MHGHAIGFAETGLSVFVASSNVIVVAVQFRQEKIFTINTCSTLI